MSTGESNSFSCIDVKHGRHYSRVSNGFNFDYLVSRKVDLGLPVVVFFNGAVDRSRAPDGVVFQRSSWAEDIDAHLICVNDGCLVKDPRARLAWAQGDRNVDYLRLVAFDLAEILAEFPGTAPDVYLYGSSGGGFQALRVGGLMNVAGVLVNNPQTDWHRYEIAHTVRRANALAYGDEELEDARRTFADRISIMDFYCKADYAPSVRYLVNAASRNDFVEQFTPFAEEFSAGRFSLPEFEASLYYNADLGHSPLPKRETLKEIGGLISSK